MLYKNKYLFYGVEIISKSSNVLLLFILPLIISDTVYSVFAIAWSLDVVFTEILGFGQNQFLLRNLNLSIYPDKKIILNNSYFISVVGFLLICLITVLIQYSNLTQIDKIPVFEILLHSLIAAILNNRLTFLRVLGRIREYISLRFISSVMKLFIFLSIIYLKGRISDVALAFLFSSITCLIILFIDNYCIETIKLTIELRKSLKQFFYNLGLTLHVIFGIILSYYDRIITIKFLPLSDANAYYFNSSLVGTSFIIPNLIAMWLLPMAFKEGVDTLSLLKKFLFQSLVLLLIFILIFNFIGLFLIKEFFGTNYLLDHKSYTLLYLVSFMNLFLNYFHYLLLWRSFLYVEALLTPIVFILSLFTLYFLNPANIFQYISVILFNNVIMLLLLFSTYRVLIKKRFSAL